MVTQELEINVPKKMSRQEFYRFALFRGFTINTDRKYRPKTGDMVFLDQRNEDDSLSVISGYILSKFGRRYLRTYHKVGWQDISLDRVDFLGKMVFKSH